MIYFDPEASADTMEQIQSEVADIAGVEEASVVQGDDAPAEIERLFASDPAALEAFLAAGVPSWMRVRVADAAILDEVEALVRVHSEFTSIQTASGIPTDDLSDAELERWCS